MKHFNGKNIYITGGSSGIGLEIGKKFSILGANVFIFSRNRINLQEAINEISALSKSSTQKFNFHELDVSVKKDIEKVIEFSVNNFGIPDIVINCAGRAIPHYFEEISFEQFDQTMKTNIYSVWNITQNLLPHMKLRGGHIVNVSSIAGFLGIIGLSDYCISKFGIVGLSEALRDEFDKYNIKISVLCPPDTDTPGFHNENKTKPVETHAISEGATLLSPEKVASALIKGLRNDKFLIVPGFDGKFTLFMKRHFPKLVEMFFKLKIRKVQKESVTS